MKALIFNGSETGDEVLSAARRDITDELVKGGCEVDSVDLGEEKIAPCMGCFDCWLKTPGICVIKDSGRGTTASAVKSDIWFFLTKVEFGGYSSHLKKAVDRILPIFVPVFTNVGGEVHHRLRYDKHPVLIGVGHGASGSDDRDEIFKQLIGRNALNFRSPYHSAEVLRRPNDRQKVVEMTKRALYRAKEAG